MEGVGVFLTRARFENRLRRAKSAKIVELQLVPVLTCEMARRALRFYETPLRIGTKTDEYQYTTKGSKFHHSGSAELPRGASIL